MMSAGHELDDLDFVARERYEKRYDQLVMWGTLTPPEAHAEALRFAVGVDRRPRVEVRIDDWDVVTWHE